MAQPIVLLGAGASIDAGVPGAFALTRQIYEYLGARQPNSAKLFGYVVAKLTTQAARDGRSPFDPINVEIVYDTLKRFVERGNDPVNEFINSWDETIVSSRFDRVRFQRYLSQSFKLSRRLDGIGIAAESHNIRLLSEMLSSAFGAGGIREDAESALRPYIEALAECLKGDEKESQYLINFTRFCSTEVGAIGTLNYDLLLENHCDFQNIEYDYGISDWNEKKLVNFKRGSLPIIKMHGSISWYESGDNISLGEKAGSHSKRALIFGGQGVKLVPHGPYLQLRHAFDKRLRDTNRLGIVGYSFQDVHINALLRVWISTKRRAKLVILNPGLPSNSISQLGRWFDVNQYGKISKYRIEVVHIDATAKSGMARFLEELRAEPVLPSLERNNIGIRVEKL